MLSFGGDLPKDKNIQKKKESMFFFVSAIQRLFFLLEKRFSLVLALRPIIEI